MHASGQTNELSENGQQRCVNPRDCISSPYHGIECQIDLLVVSLKEGGIAGVSERTSYDSFTKQLVFLGGQGETEQAQIVRITPETEDMLKDMIRNNNLQKIQSNNPPTPWNAEFSIPDYDLAGFRPTIFYL
jgi:hypothetical protein